MRPILGCVADGHCAHTISACICWKMHSCAYYMTNLNICSVVSKADSANLLVAKQPAIFVFPVARANIVEGVMFEDITRLDNT